MRGTIKSIAVIGSHADVGVLSGGGSAQVDPPGGNAVPPPPGSPTGLAALLSEPVYHRSSPLKAIRAKAPDAKVEYDAGTDPAAAAALAKGVRRGDRVRQSARIAKAATAEPLAAGQQDELVSAVAAANPHTIVVLETGGPVTMPWIDKVSAVLEAWYPGHPRRRRRSPTSCSAT